MVFMVREWVLIAAVVAAVGAFALLWSLTRRTPAIRVIIYGVHSDDWMTALAPDAPVWKMIGGVRVREVAIVPDTPAAQVPPPAGEVDRTVVIPLMEVHTRHRPRGLPALVPDERSLRILSDKAEFAAFAKANGLARNCPTTYVNGADVAFPCVLKRTNLNAGHGVAVVDTPQHLQSLLRGAPWQGEDFILQSLTTGATEYVTHCVCRNGEILWHCSFAYDMGAVAEIRGPGSAEAPRSVSAAQHTLQQIEAFLAPLRYTGPCNIDYKLLENGDIAVFEINPRLGGSLMRPENLEYLRSALSCIIDAALQRPA